MEWPEARDRLLAMQPVSPTEIGTVTGTGLYAWWDSGSAITYPSDFPPVDRTRPLYVGLAEKSGLNVRGMEMHLKNTRVSGLRRNLASLLVDELKLSGGVIAQPKKKFSLSVECESVLTSWMVKRLTVTWVTHLSPGTVERDIVDDLLPPLNSTFAHKGDYWRHTAQLRAALHAEAAKTIRVRR
jgi:hypothetical protein